MPRLASLPVIILLLYIPHGWAAWVCLALYIMGALTDWLDGWVARRYKQTSAFGTFLDPIADKIFVGVLMVVLIATGRIDGILTLGVVIILTPRIHHLRPCANSWGQKISSCRSATWPNGRQPCRWWRPAR